jgi:hypothetical protein
MNWVSWLKQRPSMPEARLLLAIGGTCPSKTLAKIDASLAQGKSDKETHAMRTDTLLKLRGEWYRRNVAPAAPSPSEWTPIGEGAFMKRAHIPMERGTE